MNRQSSKKAALSEQEVLAQKELVLKLRPKLRVAMCLAILGAVLISTTIKDVVNGHFTEPWVSTKGKIISSSIVRTMRFQFPKKVSTHPSFTYSFIANGQLTESKDEAFDSDDEKKVGNIVAQFPEGKEITVHYLQQFPGDSYFDHDGSLTHSPLKLYASLLGLILLLLAMKIMFKLRKIARPS